MVSQFILDKTKKSYIYRSVISDYKIFNISTDHHRCPSLYVQKHLDSKFKLDFSTITIYNMYGLYR